MNETHATLTEDLNLEFFNALSNALNLVLVAKQKNNACLNEEDAKMVCRLLKIKNQKSNIQICIQFNIQSIKIQLNISNIQIKNKKIKLKPSNIMQVSVQ